MKRSSLLAGLVSLAAFTVGCSEYSTAPRSTRLVQPDLATAQVQSRYIVRFRDSEADAPGQSDRLVRAHHGRLAYTYRAAIKGFAGDFSDQDIAALSLDPSVVSIERDQIAHATSTQLNPPSWGLDRIDQQALPLSSSYTYNATGAGVTVYIIDTGIWFTHTEFGGRAVSGVDEITSGGTATDCNGHGTHVSGTVGGSTYGVAKGVSLVAVRVLDCGGSGSYAQVIAGVDWVTQQKLASPSTPMAANMSLGGPLSSALNAAVTNSVAVGVTYAVAAGNSGANACNESPSSTPDAITVAATNITDGRASFSNFGTCVDIFGPGVNITSAWYTSNSATNTISGTSMASPHVAGAAALYLELNPTASPATVASALTANATLNVVVSPGAGSPNRLLYTGFIGGGGGPPPPVADFTFNCTQLNCSFDGSSSTAQANATYAWIWGDGSANGSGQTATHGYAAAGTYSVTLTVSDAGGTNSRTQSVTVTVPAPVVNISVSCVGLTCSYDGTSSIAQSNATYIWGWGEGLTTPGKTATHTWPSPGTYPARLTISDAGGTSFKVIKVTVTNAPPPPQPIASFTFNCTLLNCSFDGSGSTAQANATYAWVWGDGSTNGAGKMATHSYGAPGPYSVTLTVTDAGGSNSVTRTVTTTAPPPPQPVASFTFNCTVLDCSFDGSGSTAQANATYAWVWGDGSPNSTGKTATHSYGGPGTYSVTLTVSDAGGTNSRTQSVTVTVPLPVVIITFSCVGLTCSFDGTSSIAQPNATYTWRWGEGLSDPGKTATHTWATAGTYPARLTIIDAGGTSFKVIKVTVQ